MEGGEGQPLLRKVGHSLFRTPPTSLKRESSRRVLRLRMRPQQGGLRRGETPSW